VAEIPPAQRSLEPLAGRVSRDDSRQAHAGQQDGGAQQETQGRAQVDEQPRADPAERQEREPEGPGACEEEIAEGLQGKQGRRGQKLRAVEDDQAHPAQQHDPREHRHDDEQHQADVVVDLPLELHADGCVTVQPAGDSGELGERIGGHRARHQRHVLNRKPVDGLVQPILVRAELIDDQAANGQQGQRDGCAGGQAGRSVAHELGQHRPVECVPAEEPPSGPPQPEVPVEPRVQRPCEADVDHRTPDPQPIDQGHDRGEA